MSITIGSWIFPLLFTIIAIVFCIIKDSSRGRSYSYGAGIGDALVSAVFWVPAIILSLVAWLIWALFFK